MAIRSWPTDSGRHERYGAIAPSYSTPFNKDAVCGVQATQGRLLLCLPIPGSPVMPHILRRSSTWTRWCDHARCATNACSRLWRAVPEIFRPEVGGCHPARKRHAGAHSGRLVISPTMGKASMAGERVAVVEFGNGNWLVIPRPQITDPRCCAEPILLSASRLGC
jgi:hypothetical protein